jgi:hypothetical protein
VPGALYAQEPVAVFKVLSKSTGWIDQSLKLRDYDATPTVRTYVLISQAEPTAMVYSRDEDRRLGIQSADLLTVRMRRSISPSSAWRCRFPPSTRGWSSRPVGRQPPDQHRTITASPRIGVPRLTRPDECHGIDLIVRCQFSGRARRLFMALHMLEGHMLTFLRQRARDAP